MSEEEASERVYLFLLMMDPETSAITKISSPCIGCELLQSIREQSSPFFLWAKLALPKGDPSNGSSFLFPGSLSSIPKSPA